jgi:hypothetical protein
MTESRNVQAWLALIDRGLDAVTAALRDRSIDGVHLRKSAPYYPFVTRAERAHIFRPDWSPAELPSA